MNRIKRPKIANNRNVQRLWWERLRRGLDVPSKVETNTREIA